MGEGWWLHVLGEGFAGWAACGVVVGDLGEDLEEVLDYVLGAFCGERVRWCGWIVGVGGAYPGRFGGQRLAAPW